jgi:hypothetical protein
MADPHEEHTASIINEMRTEELETVARLFVAAWRASAPLAGRVKVPDGTVDLQWRNTNVNPSLVVTHEHKSPDISEDGTLRELPIATKYSVGVIGEPSDFQPLWVTQKEYDIARERQIALELFDLGDKDAAASFIAGFTDEKTGLAALQERRLQLTHTKEGLHHQRETDMLDGQNETVEAQLRTAFHLRELLEIVREEESRQVARVVVSRENALED